MGRAKAIAITVATAILVAILVLAIFTYIPVYSQSPPRGLLIVSTFPNLVEDIKLIACRDDKVEYLAPPGVDPHEYQLTSKDVELAARADIIISTGHTPFENSLRRLKEEGRIKAILVEIPKIPGIVLKENPVTRKPNYHMPIYDPQNYVVFLKYLAQSLSSLRPECKSTYQSNLERVVERVAEIVASTPIINISGVGDTPVTQYAVEWTGLKLRALIVKEHGAMSSPSSIEEAKRILASGRGVAVVLKPPIGKPSKSLVDIASTLSSKIIYVPSPFSPGSILSKLEYISSQVSSLSEPVKTQKTESIEERRGEAMYTSLASILALSSIVLLLATLVKARQHKR